MLPKAFSHRQRKHAAPQRSPNFLYRHCILYRREVYDSAGFKSILCPHRPVPIQKVHAKATFCVDAIDGAVQGSRGRVLYAVTIAVKRHANWLPVVQRKTLSPGAIFFAFCFFFSSDSMDLPPLPCFFLLFLLRIVLFCSRSLCCIADFRFTLRMQKR